MKLGIIGLGRMGAAIAYRAQQAGFAIVAYDPYAPEIKEFAYVRVQNLLELADEVRVFWLMVPADKVDVVIKELLPHMRENDIVIDGGNSHFTDSIRRARDLAAHHIFFMDCGVSGGIHGKEHGFSLMIGGEKKIYEKSEPLYKALAAPNGYAYIGRSGAGHYVKMIHNGIEYGMLQAYAEGFQLIKEGSFARDDLDLATITRVWNHGSVIRSFLLQLSQEVFERDQKFAQISGEIAEGGTGKWTVQEAHEQKISVPIIEESLKVRAWSRNTGGNYATKIIAMLRNAFGGHEVKKKLRENV